MSHHLAPLDATFWILFVTAHHGDANTSGDFSKQEVIGKSAKITRRLPGNSKWKCPGLAAAWAMKTFNSAQNSSPRLGSMRS